MNPTMSSTRASTPPFPSDLMRELFMLLRDRSGQDFSFYKPEMISRRIRRRMCALRITTLIEYIWHLQGNPQEIEELVNDFSITVTSFFRDAEAWALLSQHLEDLISSFPEFTTIRAWVPGCATGEEAYSLAMILLEIIGKLNRQCTQRIFATDISAPAIQRARAGQYSRKALLGVSPARLERFFVRNDIGYRIQADVRDQITFAVHNVITDPPFASLDIVSCRNVLMYLQGDIGTKALCTFHKALNVGGLLFLGPH